MTRPPTLVRLLTLLALTALACNLGASLPSTPAPTSTPLPATPAANHAAGLDAFVFSLPGWPQVAPEPVENEGVPVGEAAMAEETVAGGGLYTCTTTPYSITKNPNEIALYNPDAAVLWPGALVRGGSHLQQGSLEPLAISREKRAPLGISLQGGGVLGIPGGVSTVVQQPVGSTMREGINQLVANALGANVAVGAGASSFTAVESHSSTQALIKLGLDARYLGSQVSARLNYAREANQYTYTAYFVQRLFTVSIDLPERPSALFSTELSEADLADLGVSAANLPLYIDSVSYGRILMFSFTSNDSRAQIAAALEFSYNAPVGGVDGFSEADLRQTLQSARIEVFALGGPNTGVQNLIREGRLSAYFEAPLAINQVEPISFTMRNLGDNKLARVANTTEYVVKECLPLSTALPQPVQWWTADDTLENAVSDVDGGGFGGVFGAGWDGQNPADKAFVLDGAGQYANTYPVLLVAPTDAAFTVSAWINPRLVNGVYTVISQVGGQLAAGEFSLRVFDGRLQFYRRPSAYSESVDVVQSDVIIPANRWTHVLAVYGSSQGSNLQVYVNGELASASVSVGRYVPQQPRPDTDLTMLRIGSNELGSDGRRMFAFNGSIDEIMIFDRALTAEEIMAMYQNFAEYKKR